jgi:hypothetical protein
MTALRIKVDLGIGETTASLTSRLAAANRLRAQDFCLDWGIRFQAVVDGVETVVAAIADKGGVALPDLMSHAYVRGTGLNYTHRGQALTRFSLRRKTVRVCPMCLAADMAASSREPRLAAYGRALWQIDAIKTCPDHGIALIAVSSDMTPYTLHDFAYHVAPVLPGINHLIAEAQPRDMTGLETYIIARLDGGRPSPFLDGLELHVAIKFCEVVGAVELFGRMTKLNDLSDEDWRLAGAAGFGIAAGGPASIGGFLSRLQATFAYTRRGHEGPQALFGRLYQLLEFGAEDPAYDPLRALVGEHIRGHLALGAGDLVFDQPVEKRTLHSIRSLSLETGQHPKRLRKLLRAAWIIGEHQKPLTDANVIFAAEEASSAVRKAKGSLSLPEAGKYLNAPRVHIKLIADNRFITPHLSATAFGAVDQYAPADLDEFLRRLFDDAKPVKAPKDDQVGIPAAAKRACCSAATIIRLILDKKLKWVGGLVGVGGYMSVLVDLNEIRGLVRGDDHGGLTPYQVACELGVTDKVSRQLIRHGKITTVDVINPINKCLQTVVMPNEVERFRWEYVSLFALAKEQGRHFRKLKQELDEAGVGPVFDVSEIGATFYRRRKLLTEISTPSLDSDSKR